MTRPRNEVRPRDCAHCGTHFQPLSDKALYCTSNCQVNAARARRRERDRLLEIERGRAALSTFQQEVRKDQD